MCSILFCFLFLLRTHHKRLIFYPDIARCIIITITTNNMSNEFPYIIVFFCGERTKLIETDGDMYFVCDGCNQIQYVDEDGSGWAQENMNAYNECVDCRDKEPHQFITTLLAYCSNHDYKEHKCIIKLSYDNFVQYCLKSGVTQNKIDEFCKNTKISKNEFKKFTFLKIPKMRITGLVSTTTLEEYEMNDENYNDADYADELDCWHDKKNKEYTKIINVLKKHEDTFFRKVDTFNIEECYPNPDDPDDELAFNESGYTYYRGECDACCKKYIGRVYRD